MRFLSLFGGFAQGHGLACTSAKRVAATFRLRDGIVASAKPADQRRALRRDDHPATTRFAFLPYGPCRDAKWLFPCLLALTFIAGCSSKSSTAAKTAPPQLPPHPWILSCNDPNNLEPALLWNGQIGIRIGRDGTGSGQPFFAIDEYQTTGEEKILELANPLTAGWAVDGKPVRPEEDYLQELDMRSGVLKTQWKTPEADFEVKCVMHPTQRIIAQAWTIKPRRDIELRFTSSVAGRNGFKPKLVEGNEGEALVEFTANGTLLRLTHNLDDNGGRWTTDASSFRWNGAARKGSPIKLERVVTFGDSPNQVSMVTARTPNLKGMGLPWTEPPKYRTYTDIEAETAGTWAKRWKTDIEIEGPVEDQQAIRSFLFYLRSGVAPENLMGVSPMGLSDALYNGHVFWDADIWVFPALALLDPDAARAIPEYRFQTEALAKANTDIPNSIKFGWESSVSGKEVSPESFRKEVHINGSVLWGLQQSADLGLIPQAAVDSLGKMVANYYRGISVEGPDGREIRQVLSPDEYRVADNDLYTNLLAQWAINRYLGEKVAFKLPRDDEGLLA